MSTGRTWQTESISLDATLKLAADLGQKLRGGELIELRGDLGSGKTSFVKGLARGLGSKDAVHSPSFTLSNEYRAEELVLYHFDFYRLNEPGIMRREIAEATEDPKGVVIVEWGGIVENALPTDRLIINLTATGEESRRLEFSCSNKLDYLC
jgi:tRNA threonylcarbamoyladenosine biosynthesis protein TsaE